MPMCILFKDGERLTAILLTMGDALGIAESDIIYDSG